MALTQTSVFLFAHQDDEVGVLAELQRVRAAGGRPVCVYLTDGATAAVTSARRNGETSAVLMQLGVAGSDIHFLGEQAGIGDGVLVAHLDAAIAALRHLVQSLGRVDRLIFHGWEGGHQDHDGVHVLGVVLAAHLELLAVSRQFPLYRAPLHGPLPYTMLRSLPANGAVEAHRIAVADRLRYLRLCLTYRSQAKTFLGLLPFIAADYALNGHQLLQPVSRARLGEPPHAGVLLYERWGRLTWERFKALADVFVAAHLPPAVAPPAGPGG